LHLKTLTEHAIAQNCSKLTQAVLGSFEGSRASFSHICKHPLIHVSAEHSAKY